MYNESLEYRNYITSYFIWTQCSSVPRITIILQQIIMNYVHHSQRIDYFASPLTTALLSSFLYHSSRFICLTFSIFSFFFRSFLLSSFLSAGNCRVLRCPDYVTGRFPTLLKITFLTCSNLHFLLSHVRSMRSIVIMKKSVSRIWPTCISSIIPTHALRMHVRSSTAWTDGRILFTLCF
jgi:hypothetical protein